MIVLQNYARKKQKSYRIMKMQISVTQEKAKRDTENIMGLNLAAANLTTVQVTKLLYSIG
jgi:hypothetical protein